MPALFHQLLHRPFASSPLLQQLLCSPTPLRSSRSASVPILTLIPNLHPSCESSLVQNPQPWRRVEVPLGGQTVAPQSHLDDLFWVVAFLHQNCSLREHGGCGLPDRSGAAGCRERLCHEHPCRLARQRPSCTQPSPQQEFDLLRLFPGASLGFLSSQSNSTV